MKTAFILILIIAISCNSKNQVQTEIVEIGQIIESRVRKGEYIHSIQFIVFDELMEIGDTLFCIVKNDSVYYAMQDSLMIYWRRWKDPWLEISGPGFDVNGDTIRIRETGEYEIGAEF